MADLLKAEDVASMLGVSKDWIYGEVRSDRIPHVRLGRNVRFRADALDEWIAGIERGMIDSSTKRRGAARTAPGLATGVKS